MPRIPFGIANPELPPGSGMRGGVVGTPVVQEPGLDAEAATMPGRALANVGQQVAQTGQYLAQAEAYQFQRQHAQDVLDGKSHLQEYRQQLLTKYDELTQGDYRTLPESTLKEGKQLIQQLGKSLTPTAKALFTEDANQVLTVMQQAALGERSKRRDQDTAFTMSREIFQVQEQLLRTTDPYAREVILGQFDDLSARFVETGLVRGQAMAEMRQKTLERVADQDVEQAIQRNPDLMVTQLFSQLNKEPTREDLPLARPDTLPKLHQQAMELSRYRFAQREHAERYADYNRKKTQEEASIPLRTSIYKTPLTPEHVPTFQKIIAQTAALIEAKELDVDTGERIMNTAQAHGVAAGKIPPRVDDPATETTISLAVRMAERSEHFEQARQMLTSAAQAQKLRPETFGSLYDKLEQREAAAQWREFPEVKDAKNILMRGALVPFGGTLAGQMKPKMQQKLTWATDMFEEQLQRLFDDPQAGPREVKRQAKAVAWEARRQGLQPDIDNAADAEEYLPPQVQQATTPVELAQAIHSLRMLGWSNGSLLIIRDNWHRWMETPENKAQRQGQPAPRSTPTPGASTMPKSYQLPSAGTSSGGERRSN